MDAKEFMLKVSKFFHTRLDVNGVYDLEKNIVGWTATFPDVFLQDAEGIRTPAIGTGSHHISSIDNLYQKMMNSYQIVKPIKYSQTVQALQIK